MEPMGGAHGGAERPGGTEIKRVSANLIEVTIDDVTFEVGVQEIYVTHMLFGEFRSLEVLVERLRALRQEVPATLLEMHHHGH
jgi:hypothetical protein